ncbi:MAG TPA: chemotaxis protein CheW [Spongiibacteraceae bacterium]|jgi:purine-binding chemotaxis protein CheW
MDGTAGGRVVIFELDTQRFALPLAIVTRVERAIAITILPEAPAVIAGVINVRGVLLPVISLRRRLLLPERTLSLSDQLIVARGSRRIYALLVDAVLDVADYAAADFVAAQTLSAGGDSFHGALRLPDGIVLIHDIDRFLSLEDERALAQALTDV